MSYERLTEKCAIGDNYYIRHCDTVNCDGVCSMCDYDHDVINRLAELEDKNEQGTLIELPCKVGDKVCKFIVKENKQFFIIEAVCIKIEISRKGVLYMFSTLTSRYFHENFFGKLSDDFIDVEQYYICTKEEAEARLKELRGEI